MATLTLEEVADRLVNSLNTLEPGKWFDVMGNYRDYPMMRAVNQYGKEKTGKKVETRLGVGSTTPDGHHGLYEDHDLDRPDVMATVTTPWRHDRDGFVIDVRELDLGALEQIVDDNQTLMNNTWSNISERVENGAWRVPAVADELLEFGIPYWVVWNGTEGHNGQLPAGGHTAVGGIDPAVEPKHRNYTNTWSAATWDDLGRKLLLAMRKTNFRPAPNTQGSQSTPQQIYTTIQTALDLQAITRAQNDSNGADLDAQRPMVSRVKPTDVPSLEDNATSGSEPIYLINHNFLYPCFKRGWKFHWFPAMKEPKQPTAVGRRVNWTYNWHCNIRRNQGVLAKSAPFGEA